jgi:hypothetical protein
MQDKAHKYHIYNTPLPAITTTRTVTITSIHSPIGVAAFISTAILHGASIPTAARTSQSMVIAPMTTSTVG